MLGVNLSTQLSAVNFVQFDAEGFDSEKLDAEDQMPLRKELLGGASKKSLVTTPGVSILNDATVEMTMEL